MALLLVALLSLSGGLCQSITGFGSAIIMMMLMPELFPINTAAGITVLTRKAKTMTNLYFQKYIKGGSSLHKFFLLQV